MLQQQFLFWFFLLQMVLFNSKAQELIPYRKGKFWGYADKIGNIVIEPVFTNVDWQFYNGIAGVQLNGKGNFINRQGHVLIDSFYKHVSFTGEYFIVWNEDYCQVLNEKGKLISELKFDKVEFYIKKNILAKYQGKYGVMNIEGKWLAKPEYDWIQMGDNGYFMISEGNMTWKKQSYFNEKGKRIFEREYIYGDAFKNNYARIRSEEVLFVKWYFFRKVKICTLHYGESDVCETFRPLRIKRKTEVANIIDNKGRLLLPKGLKTNYVQPYHGVLIASTYNGNKFGAIDTLGKVVVKPEYDKVEYFMDEFLSLEKGKMRSLYNLKTRRLLKPDSVYFSAYSNGVITVVKDGKYSFIDTGNTAFLPKNFDWANSKDGMLSGGKDGKVYWMDAMGKILLVKDTSELKGGFPFDKNNCAMVSKQSGFGLIDRGGNQIFPCEYAGFYGDGMEGFYRTGKYKKPFYSAGIVSSEGKIIVPLEYHSVSMSKGKSNFIVKKEELFGLFDLQGNLVLDFNYYEIGSLDDNYFILVKPNPDFNLIPDSVVVTESGHEQVFPRKRGENEPAQYFYYLADKNGKILTQFNEYPQVINGYLYFTKPEGFMSLDGRKFFED